MGLCAGMVQAADFTPAERTGAAIQKAIDAAFAAGGGRVVLERDAVYPSGTLYLKSHVELHVPEGTVIRGGGASADYDDDIMRQIEKAAAGKDSASDENDSEDAAPGANPFSDYDELLPQAVDVILDTKQASVSMLQRRLKLGYSRAARLVDQMEELGIVGPFEGSKPRQLLITREQWQEMSMTGNTAVEQLINQQKDDFSGSCAQ